MEKASKKIIDLEEEKEGQVKANGPCPTDLEDNNENKDKNEVTFEDSVKKEGMITHSMKKIQENEDAITTYWMKVEQRENFENYAVYTVEIPTKEQNTPEVKEAKHKEIENLVRYDVFEEVDDCGQERIGSRWVVTQEEKADRQKSQIKNPLVAKGFQEE